MKIYFICYYFLLQAPGQKYFKRNDLIVKEEEEYMKKYGPKIDTSQSTSSKKDLQGRSCWFLFLFM
jgi:hypothetical protein